MPQPRSPPFISPPLLIILLPILALTLFFIAVPPLLSAASNALRPVSVVKTSWDSLNILLVVLAICCGVFARRNDDEPSPQDAVPEQNGASSLSGDRVGRGGYELPSPPQQQHWFGFSEDTKVYDAATPTMSQSPATGVTRLRRSSSSYPDLRQWDTGDHRYQFRFFDDFEIDKQSRSPLVEHRQRWPEPEPETPEDKEEVRVKEIPVDTFEVRTPPPVKSAAPPPPPPPPPPPADSARRNPRRAPEKVENEITEVDDNEFTRIQSPPSAIPSTLPSPPRPSVKARSEHKKSERRKSNVKREIAMVWASVLSNPRKRKKKQRNRTDESHNQHYNNVDEVTHSTTAPPPTPPPPPPPPPPPSVFHSLFRKGMGKNKKIHSVSAPPPPPPLPLLTSSRRWSTRKSQIPPPPAPPPEPPRRRNSGRPPLPNKVDHSNSIDEAINAGNQSPLIPAPPPPPPFKMTAMKFTVRGGFVNVRSNQSSRSSSPEREHIDVEVSNKTTTTTNTATATATTTATVADVGGAVFCPSPDVNLKAATFIARLRGEWRLEKLNSIKEKSNGSLPPPGRGYSL